MALLDFLTQRSIVTLIAVVGAAAVMLASYVNRAQQNPRSARTISIAGYGLTLFSVLLFIIAGFRVN